MRDSIDNGLGSEPKPKAKPKEKRAEVDPKRKELKATNGKLQAALRSLKRTCDRVHADIDTFNDSVPFMQSKFMQSPVMQEVVEEIHAGRALYAAEVVEKDEIDVEKLSDVQRRVAHVDKANSLIDMAHKIIKNFKKKQIIDCGWMTK